jgi:hypothetical protein
MGENMEMGDVGKNGQASLNLTQTCTLPRVTAETPEKRLNEAENVETGDVGRKRESNAYIDANTYIAPCYSGNS